jgi:hypothetical protein
MTMSGTRIRSFGLGIVLASALAVLSGCGNTRSTGVETRKVRIVSAMQQAGTTQFEIGGNIARMAPRGVSFAYQIEKTVSILRVTPPGGTLHEISVPGAPDNEATVLLVRESAPGVLNLATVDLNDELTPPKTAVTFVSATAVPLNVDIYVLAPNAPLGAEQPLRMENGQSVATQVDAGTYQVLIRKRGTDTVVFQNHAMRVAAHEQAAVMLYLRAPGSETLDLTGVTRFEDWILSDVR